MIKVATVPSATVIPSYVAECTAKDIDAELEQMRKDILEYKNVFRTERDKLDRLALEYEASKKYNPTQRYGVLKSLIKSITKGSACPTPSHSGTSLNWWRQQDVIRCVRNKDDLSWRQLWSEGVDSP